MATTDPAVAAAQRAWDGAGRVGWVEFIRPQGATTHIACVFEDGSIYLPEGMDAVDEIDYRLAAASDRFWPLPRPVDVAREALAPVRQEIERLRGIWNRDNEEHKSVRVVLDRLSTLVYTSEELQ